MLDVTTAEVTIGFWLHLIKSMHQWGRSTIGYWPVMRKKIWFSFLNFVGHPCAGAMLIFSVFISFLLMAPPEGGPNVKCETLIRLQNSSTIPSVGLNNWLSGLQLTCENVPSVDKNVQWPHNYRVLKSLSGFQLSCSNQLQEGMLAITIGFETNSKKSRQLRGVPGRSPSPVLTWPCIA